MSQPEDPDRPEPAGRMRPTSGRAITLCVVLGLLLGWSIRRGGEAFLSRSPLVSWAQALALVLVAVIMAFLAWQTWQSVQVRRERLEPHQAVNRLVLARACALGGSLVAAGYVGYAVSWLGDESEYADRWVLRAVVAAVGAAGAAAASLVLERACRADGGGTRP